MSEITTGCVCKLLEDGFCTRHNVKKNPHFHHLCQTNDKYFTSWEQCRGIGQNFADCAKNSDSRPIENLPEKKKPCQCSQENVKSQIELEKIAQKQEELRQEELKKNLPSLWEQAKNLAGATVDHVVNGMKISTESLVSYRTKICESCPLFIVDQRRCGKCGCYVDMKVKSESSRCPDTPPRW